MTHFASFYPSTIYMNLEMKKRETRNGSQIRLQAPYMLGQPIRNYGHEGFTNSQPRPLQH